MTVRQRMLALKASYEPSTTLGLFRSGDFPPNAFPAGHRRMDLIPGPTLFGSSKNACIVSFGASPTSARQSNAGTRFIPIVAVELALSCNKC